MPLKFLFLCVFIGSVLAFTTASAQQTELGPVVRFTESGVRAVAISAQPSDLAPLLKRAFTLHGGFTVVEPAKADFTFRFDAVDGNTVRLSIQSGSPAVTQFSQDVRGESSQVAALRAADLAVSRTLGIPGFFAGKLAFVNERTGKREIYTSDLFFQNVSQLTRDNSNSIMPRWSPDGSRILYTGYYRSGFPDIFQIDLRSGRRTPFASYSGSNTGAVFSPDGRHVAMILSSPGNPELFVSDSEGRNPRRLTRNDHVEATPTWAPDSRRIIVVNDGLGGPQLFVIGVEGGPLQRIPTNISGYCAEPNWNPVDQNLVVFTAAVRGQYQLAIYDFGSRQSRWLTSGRDTHVEPVWLNDGRHVICTLRRPNANQLVIFDTITGNRAVLHSPGFGSTSQAAFVYPNPPR